MPDGRAARPQNSRGDGQPHPHDATPINERPWRDTHDATAEKGRAVLQYAVGHGAGGAGGARMLSQLFEAMLEYVDHVATEGNENDAAAMGGAAAEDSDGDAGGGYVGLGDNWFSLDDYGF